MTVLKRAPVLCLAIALTFTAACARERGREYELRGQILAVDTARQEITVKHQDIVGFMPGMTMAFKVREPRLMEGRSAGDLIRATLVVEDTQAYLKTVDATGHAPLTEAPPPPRIDPLEPGADVPDAGFVDHDGQGRRLSEWRGRVVAVTFIYTRCPLPTFCPVMDRNFAEVQRQVLADEHLRGRVQLLSISFDPSFDTPAVIAKHAKTLGADPSTWIFLTGDRSEVEGFAAKFGVSVMREGASPTEVLHNLRTGVIDSNGRLRKIFNGTEWQPADLVAELRSTVGVR